MCRKRAGAGKGLGMTPKPSVQCGETRKQQVQGGVTRKAQQAARMPRWVPPNHAEIRDLRGETRRVSKATRMTW